MRSRPTLGRFVSARLAPRATARSWPQGEAGGATGVALRLSFRVWRDLGAPYEAARDQGA